MRRASGFEVSEMVSWMEKLEQARAAGAARDVDPIRALIEDTVRGMENISTNSLLTLIGLPVTTANARRVAPIMAALGFVPIKSRRFMPGSFRGTVTRGWGRPFRKLGRCGNSKEGEKFGTSRLNTLKQLKTDDPKEAFHVA
jgi:hypothetical protein